MIAMSKNVSKIIDWFTWKRFVVCARLFLVNRIVYYINNKHNNIGIQHSNSKCFLITTNADL